MDGQSLLVLLNFSGRTRKAPQGVITEIINKLSNMSAVSTNTDNVNVGNIDADASSADSVEPFPTNNIIMSNYDKKAFDGLLQPYEALILKGRCPAAHDRL